VTTLTQWLWALAETHGPADALVEPGGVPVSFADVERRVARLAGGLEALGVGRGDRLASFVPNGVLPVELLLAGARLGAVFIGVNTRYRSEDLRHLLERARPRVLIAAENFLGIDYPGIVKEAMAALDEGRGVASGTHDPGQVGSAGHPARPMVVWPADLPRLRAAPPVTEDRAADDDLLVAFTTSGTTGRPKLAAHDHATTVRHLDAAGRSLEAEPGAAALLGLPFCGTFGFVSLLAVLSGGGRGIVPSRFEPGEAAGLIEHHGVTHFNGSDDMLLAVCDAGRDLSTWRHGVHGEFTGRGLECVRRAEAWGARITGVYGSSETFALLARWLPAEPDSVRGRNGGRLVDPAMQVRVVDGELQLKGPSVLSAYLDEHGTTPPPLVDGGWFRTGDLAVAEPDGGFVYLARTGDALRLAGFLTDPAEIEQHLMTHPAVTGAQVVGVPAEGRGEVAVAFVTTSQLAAEADLLDHCRASLANYKVPVRVVTVDAFPTVEGANGVKIRKTELRERARQLTP
jgi:fatty-acyl-CoA synthase